MEWDLAKSGRRVKTDDVEEDKELKWERNSVSLGKSAQIYQAAFFAAPQARRGIRKTPFIGDRKSSLRLFGKREFLDTLVFPNGETPVLLKRAFFYYTTVRDFALPCSSQSREESPSEMISAME